ncbi:MAG: ATP-binding protein [Thermoactinomyces sp.]
MTGLGMAIAKQLIEAHGGRIEVESAPGQGTVIRLSFPVMGDVRRTATNHIRD